MELINPRALKYAEQVQRYGETPVLKDYDDKGKGLRIRQAFLDVNMVNRRDGLSEIARKRGVNVAHMKDGDFLLFVNYTRTQIALYTRVGGPKNAVEGVSYWYAPHGSRITNEFIKSIPKVFGSNQSIGFAEAMDSLFKDYLVPRKTVKLIDAEKVK